MFCIIYYIMILLLAPPSWQRIIISILINLLTWILCSLYTLVLIIWRGVGYVLYWYITCFLCLLCMYFTCNYCTLLSNCVVLVTIHALWILNQIHFCSVLFDIDGHANVESLIPIIKGQWDSGFWGLFWYRYHTRSNGNWRGVFNI
jgi:hypothetical protein